MAHAMGRTLVLPPEQRMYLLTKGGNDQQKKDFGFQDFFPLSDISNEQEGLEIITMEEFLLREGVTGRLKDSKTGAVTYPPGNRTDWNGDTNAVSSLLSPWLHDIAYAPTTWSPDKCMAAFPSSADISDTETLQKTWDSIIAHGLPPKEAYIGRPTPVHASFEDRMKENAMEREHLCIYNQTMQQEPLVHFSGKKQHGGRLLVNFYAFLFFQDWKEDLWMKRFIRDHIRYVDEIQCAAARIVLAVRERAKQRDPKSNGEFDSFHVRRGDFQYKKQVFRSL
jgi:GDP-fucose protein O-fucosyltransferase